jgi:hypothetical protein
MSVTFWSNDGNGYSLETVVQILAYEFDGPIIYLEFRLRQCEDSWWHFHGRMDRELKHGRFTVALWPVPNVQSDEKFGMDWADRFIESDAPRSIQELMECTKSYKSDSKEFGMDWTDQKVESDTSRRPRELVKGTKSYRLDFEEQCYSCSDQK